MLAHQCWNPGPATAMPHRSGWTMSTLRSQCSGVWINQMLNHTWSYYPRILQRKIVSLSARKPLFKWCHSLLKLLCYWSRIGRSFNIKKYSEGDTSSTSVKHENQSKQFKPLMSFWWMALQNINMGNLTASFPKDLVTQRISPRLI